MDFIGMLSNAIGNPGQQANAQDLSGLMGVARQVSGQQAGNAAIAPQLMSVVGSFVRSALQDKRRQAGTDQAHDVVQRYGSTNASPEAVEALFSPQAQRQVARSAAQETGVQEDQVLAMLPTLVPLVLKFLQGGAPTQGGQGANTLLASFLDADRDGDVDIGDALQAVGRFMPR